MPEATIAVMAYNGAFTDQQLLSQPRRLPVEDLGPLRSGLLSEDEAIRGASGGGIADFDGQPMIYLGSGLARLAGTPAEAAAALPVLAFRVPGRVYFHFPEGPPAMPADPAQAPALSFSLSPRPYKASSPVCFGKGTLIATDTGERPVEDLRAGDFVVDVAGRRHRINLVCARETSLPLALAASYSEWLPVRIPKDSLGPGLPHRDLILSQQHRVLVSSHWADMLFGAHDVLVAAKALAGDRIRVMTEVRTVSYYHILCKDHVVMTANGLPAESLFLGDFALRGQGRAAAAESLEIFPQLGGQLRRMRAAYPMLKPREGRLLAHSLS
jgi:hypothetical protein